MVESSEQRQNITGFAFCDGHSQQRGSPVWVRTGGSIHSGRLSHQLGLEVTGLGHSSISLRGSGSMEIPGCCVGKPCIISKAGFDERGSGVESWVSKRQSMLFCAIFSKDLPVTPCDFLPPPPTALASPTWMGWPSVQCLPCRAAGQ